MNAARKMRARSYFMSGDMDSHVNLCAMRKYIRLHAPGAYLMYKTYARVCRTVHCVLRKQSRPFAIPALWMLSYE